jgi:putative aldouronate transport system permease protein
MFDAGVVLILLLVGVVFLFPILLVISMSLTSMSEMLKQGGFSLLPRAPEIEAYKRVLSNSQIGGGYTVTVALTVIGTLLNLALTATLAYPLSVRDLPWRKPLTLYLAFTMLFNGGLIPTYMVVRATGLIDSFWAMIIPNAVWASYVILLRLFFENVPRDLFESARMDGAGELLILWRIAMPLSVPALVTIGLFYGVGHWNQFLQAVLYVTSTGLYPLQLIIRNIILESERIDANFERAVPTMAFRMAAVIAASAPIIAIYPFLQRFFIRGLTIGAVKG